MTSLAPFDNMEVQPIGAADSLLRPDESRYQRFVYQATDVSVARDFLSDPHLVPKGLIRDEDGRLRAVFWQRRAREAS